MTTNTQTAAHTPGLDVYARAAAHLEQYAYETARYASCDEDAALATSIRADAETVRAGSALLAAAPDLLSALEALAQVPTSRREFERTLARAKAAIARAKGSAT